MGVFATRKAAWPCCAAALLCLFAAGCSQSPAAQTVTTVTMDTIASQEAYGAGAQNAMQAVNIALSQWEKQMSRFVPEGDIGRVNAGAGSRVAVSPDTARFVRQALALSAQSRGSFALSIEPLTDAWGVKSDNPRVPPDDELAALLPLVNDSAVIVQDDSILLQNPGMGLDLGGIAKGAACDIARDIYDEYGISGAFLDIGGNVYVHGHKPDGSRFRIAFNDPLREGSRYIASFEMEDEVLAMSGGSERFFEQDGRRYIHIINPATGCPAESDILTVGAVCPTGTEADFWSTTLFIWGKQATLAHMESGGCAVMLDGEKNLYVSESLRDSFELHVPEGEYNLIFVAGG